MDFSGTKVLVFDLDYTLLDSSAGIVYCFNEARKRVGEPEIDAELLTARIGLPIEEGFRVFGSKDPIAMRELFRKIARDGAMAERSFLLEGVATVIPELKSRGYRLAVASTKSRAEIERVLEHLGIHEYFEAFVGSDEVEFPKPAPDSLFLAMERVGVEAEDVVYVGDHVVDVRAARGAGIRVIALEGGPCSSMEIQAQEPDAFLKSALNVLDIL